MQDTSILAGVDYYFITYIYTQEKLGTEMNSIIYKTVAAAAFLSFFTLSSIAFAGEEHDHEESAKNLEKKLVAPCCFRQPVATHLSGAATAAKINIRRLLNEGKSEEEIIDEYVAEYGERILAAPRTEGFGITAYLLPIVALLLATTVIVMRGMNKKPVLIEFKSSVKPGSDYDDRLDDELKGF